MKIDEQEKEANPLFFPTDGNLLDELSVVIPLQLCTLVGWRRDLSSKPKS